MDESGGWLVMRRISAFLTKSCQRMSRILRIQAPLVHCMNPLYIRLVNCPAFRSVKHYRQYEDPVLMEFGQGRPQGIGAPLPPEVKKFLEI